jgi:hypothetical protein
VGDPADRVALFRWDIHDISHCRLLLLFSPTHATKRSIPTGSGQNGR